MASTSGNAERGVGPRPLVRGEWSTGFTESLGEHCTPSCDVVEGDADGVLDESRHARSLAGVNETADLLDLFDVECDRDLASRHTNDHINQAASEVLSSAALSVLPGPRSNVGSNQTASGSDEIAMLCTRSPSVRITSNSSSPCNMCTLRNAR